MATTSQELTVGLPRRGPIGAVVGTICDLIRRRRLVWYLAAASARANGGNSLLGNLWWFIDPAIQLGIYYLLVAVIFQKSQPAYILFLACAIIPWKWFTTAIAGATNSVRGREAVLRQISFPQIVLPMAEVLAETGSFFFALVPLAALYLVYPERLTPWVLAIPAVAFVQLLWTIPIAILLSAFNVFLRDIGLFTTHALRIWLYASPALFTIELLRRGGEKYPIFGVWVNLNPFTWIFGGYRDLLYYGHAPDWASLVLCGLASIPVTLLSLYIFKRMSPSFVKVL